MATPWRDDTCISLYRESTCGPHIWGPCKRQNGPQLQGSIQPDGGIAESHLSTASASSPPFHMQHGELHMPATGDDDAQVRGHLLLRGPQSGRISACCWPISRHSHAWTESRFGPHENVSW
jgi:hypothetical protein